MKRAERPNAWGGPGAALAIGALAACTTTAACGGCGEKRTAVEGRLDTGPGLLLVERGELHNGTFELGAPIEADGTFSVDLPSAGVWGLHFYVEGTFYLPVGITVEENEVHELVQSDIDWDALGWWVNLPADPTILPMLADPDTTDDPVAGTATLDEPAPGTFTVTFDVNDPNMDLSVQILMYIPATGAGVALNPPGPPMGGFYPNGVYTATVFAPEDLDRTQPWYLLAADRGCSMSAIVELAVP